MALCYEFCAWAESALLYEAGERELDGNWLWGSYLSMFIVWMLFLFEYFNIISGDKAGAIKRIFVYMEEVRYCFRMSSAESFTGTALRTHRETIMIRLCYSGLGNEGRR